ncbi:MAG TPA: serine/threonine protein kinase, partial [Gammaproteobacteria bacterium]|nr:serine/threonine protein kinase [Gammaproteobacteria bacterium]
AGGTGPVLTIEAGSTLAFNDASDYLVVNRGSQIIADGTAIAPITFTSVTDAVLATVTPEAVQQWGGVVINGNGITNNCTDAQRATNDCHVESEGQPVYYGGNNNAESSGVLRYVVVKHTGSEVAPDDELNGITFNAVGSGTTVSFLETYSTYDDGIEFFGGAVNVDHYVGVYVKDDSIDFSDGYVGTVDTALVIQSLTDGNRCIEGDNIGDTRAAAGVPLDTLPMTNPTIRNLTCIIANGDANTHDPAEGPTLRRGPQMQLADSIIFGAYADDVGGNNECFEFAGDGVTNNWAQLGATTVTDTLIACELATQSSAGNRLPNGDTENEWVLGANPSTNGANYSFNVGNVIIQAPDLFANASLSVLDCFYTRPAMTDTAGAAITFAGTGAVTRADDWTANWTYGLHATSRGKALWFEAPSGPCVL